MVLRNGIKRHPTREIKSIPVTATPNPTNEKSNILKFKPLLSRRNEEAIIFGGVPINVVIPPNNEANAKGIKIFEAGIPFFIEICNATGSKSAKAPTLFIKADRIATIVVSASNCVTIPPLRRSINWPMTSTKPEF